MCHVLTPVDGDLSISGIAVNAPDILSWLAKLPPCASLDDSEDTPAITRLTLRSNSITLQLASVEPDLVVTAVADTFDIVFVGSEARQVAMWLSNKFEGMLDENDRSQLKHN